MNYGNPGLRTRLAAEYALGTLAGAARRRFEGLMAADPRLRREVRGWQEDLYGLIERLPAEPVPDRVWTHIEQRLAPSARVTALALRARERRSWLWPVWAGFATAAALMLAVYLGLARVSSPGADYVAIVDDGRGQAAWVVRREADALAVSAVRPQSLEPDRSFELWLLPPGGAAPRSLGLLPANGGTRLRLSSELTTALSAADGLAVSLEPAGGSPTGQPTGPVLYLGKRLPGA